MNISKHFSLIFGLFLSVMTMAWLYFVEQKNLGASFGYTPSVINYTDSSGTVWKHTIDASDSNLDSVNITTIRTKSAFNPSSATQTHSISFASQAVGYCTGWMFFETATITASNTTFSSYLKYCKTGAKTIEIWKTNDTTQTGASHGASTLIPTITPTPTPTATPSGTATPTPLPSTAPYALCSIIRETTTGNIKWNTLPFSYTDSNGITQNDAIQSGSYSCTGDGGNNTQGGLTGIPANNSGYINIPTGFSVANGITCTINVSTMKGTTSSCKLEEKIVNINTIQMNGQTNAWHFPVSVAGNASVSLAYGNNTHAMYALDTADNPVAMQSNIVLIADKKANEVIEWTSPNTDTGFLKDFLTGALCTPNAPCSTERVIFYGGTQKGTSSIILSNKTTKQSVSYTVHTIGSAVKNISISDTSALKITETPLSFPASIQLYNGETRNANEREISWEFSSDGGQTYTTSSSAGVVSAGKFIAKQEGLFMIRAKMVNEMAGPGTDKIKYQKETVYSSNAISFYVKKTPPWNVIINGKSASWHFPVGLRGAKSSSTTYGENFFPTATPERSVSASPSVSASATASATPAPTQTPTPTSSATPTATSAPAQTGSGNYPIVSISNIITIQAYNPNNVPLQWYSTDSNFGYLQNLSGVKCLQASPCSGNMVQFAGGTEVGITPITVINTNSGESYSYTVHTTNGSTEYIKIQNPTEKTWNQKTPVTMKLTRVSVTGNEEEIAQNSNVIWEFSYDGGSTYTSNSADGSFAAGIFTPLKEGSVLVRARLKESVASPGDVGLSTTTKEYVSQNIIAMTVEKPAIVIESARVIGGNFIAKNATAPVAITLTSKETLNTLQSFGVALFPGSINAETYNTPPNPTYIFKEIHKDVPLQEFLTEKGSQNRGIFQLPLFIPEYASMKDGYYTIMLESYRNDLVLSRYFLTVSLGEEMNNFDINEDGNVTITDVIIALKFVNGSLIPTEKEKKRTDKNGNGKLDIGDVLIIFKKAI